jgi:hypothetical protein
MKTFEIEYGGKTFEIEAPDEASAMAAMGRMSGGEQQGPPMPSRADMVNSQFDQLPWYAKAGRAVDDTARLIANGLTLGGADKLAGYMSGDVASERQATQDARDRAGWAGTAAEVGGGVATAGGLAKAGLTAARAIPQMGLFGRMGAGAIDGAALGALSGLATTDDGQYTQNAVNQGLFGAALGGAAPAVVSGVGKLAKGVTEPFRKKPVVPTSDELKASANAAYKQAEDAGVVFDPATMTGLRDRVRDRFADRGFHPSNEPGAATAMGELDRLASQNVTLKGLETARKLIGNAYQPGNKSNNALLGIARDQVDDVVARSPGGETMTEARSLWQRSAKADALETALAKAQGRAASTGSGGNIDNATRQEIRKVLDRGRGWTDDERAALSLAADGTTDQNALRLLGKLSPSGNGLMMALQSGAAGASGGMTIPLAIAGHGAKVAADRTTKRNVDEALKIILAGGSREAALGKPSAPVRAIEGNRDNLARSLLMGGLLPSWAE